eukprot:scaffold93151_cov36-Prasinocladus_malaysianus.AAC.1
MPGSLVMSLLMRLLPAKLARDNPDGKPGMVVVRVKEGAEAPTPAQWLQYDTSTQQGSQAMARTQASLSKITN